ncbi:alkaline phosphatase family protein [uncultured Propionibacterium sp.]|uniref:alkaline phosphatase family protein n=1 Tax=uncultured Propionibacterium sp. TaxID=218066 RepID=UPI00292CFEEE|nr:alkaline phosphatase family protein [uncultured Propionibacterium sp.]
MSTSVPAGPAYGSGTLAEVLPAVAQRLGAGGPCRPEAADALGIPPARAYVLMLVDGMGWNQLRSNLPSLAYIPQLLGEARPISAPVPATTACSLATLGTGCAPGLHGIVGYTFRPGASGGLLCPLDWGLSDPDPEQFQPIPTWFERLERDGVAVTTVSRDQFHRSGLTRAALRGGVFRGFGRDTPMSAKIEAIRASVAAGPALAYVYESDLDHAGHGRGVASRPWLDRLVGIDADIESLRRALPDDVCLLVTADHGMVDVPAGHRIVIEDTPGLGDQVEAVGGEGRLRHLYTREPQAVAARWAAVMGERAWVCTRGEAVAAGWFGPSVGADAAVRLGDVLVAAREDWAVMTRARRGEFSLIGQHGSLEPDEMRVPLVVDAGWA